MADETGNDERGGPQYFDQSKSSEDILAAILKAGDQTNLSEEEAAERDRRNREYQRFRMVNGKGEHGQNGDDTSP